MPFPRKLYERQAGGKRDDRAWTNRVPYARPFRPTSGPLKGRLVRFVGCSTRRERPSRDRTAQGIPPHVLSEIMKRTPRAAAPRREVARRQQTIRQAQEEVGFRRRAAARTARRTAAARRPQREAAARVARRRAERRAQAPRRLRSGTVVGGPRLRPRRRVGSGLRRRLPAEPAAEPEADSAPSAPARSTRRNPNRTIVHPLPMARTPTATNFHRFIDGCAVRPASARLERSLRQASHRRRNRRDIEHAEQRAQMEVQRPAPRRGTRRTRPATMPDGTSAREYARRFVDTEASVDRSQDGSGCAGKRKCRPCQMGGSNQSTFTGAPWRRSAGKRARVMFPI